MRNQTVQNKPPTPLQGVGVVALTAAAVILGSWLFGWLERWIGQAASLCFIAYGVLVALFLMHRYVMGYTYAASDDVLRVSHRYGRYQRFMADVWLNQVQAWGTLESVRAQYPRARVTRATRSRCDLEPLALAYRTGGKTEILVLQPDEAMRAHLLKRVKKG